MPMQTELTEMKPDPQPLVLEDEVELEPDAVAGGLLLPFAFGFVLDADLHFFVELRRCSGALSLA
jgi:hypothetical protein